MVFHGFSWLYMVFYGSRLVFHVLSWFFSKLYPPKLYPGPTIQSRSAARRAAQDLVYLNIRISAYTKRIATSLKILIFVPKTPFLAPQMIFVHWKQYLWPKIAHLGKILAAKKQIIRFFNLVLCGTADGAIVVITGIKPSSTLPVHLCRL